MSPWQQMAQTTGTSTVIGDITPGHWYQYRVTAVNVHGSRGGSLPTKAFTLSREPRKPGPPSNVTEGDTLIMGGRVAVTLHWFPPKKSDLPISRYKLYWSKKPKMSQSTQLPPLKEHRQVIPGDQVVFQIPDLEADTTYIVQIQAICQYGEVRLKSDRVTVTVTTYPLPKSDQSDAGSVGSRTLHPVHTVRLIPTPASPVRLSVDQPYYNNGILKANITWNLADEDDDMANPELDRVFVFWSPEACIADKLSDDGLAKVMSGTTQDSSFAIYDLRFDCRYLIRVQPVTNQGVSGVSSHLTISTPSCHDVVVVGDVKPDCPNNVARVPDEPPGLQHSFVINNGNITAKLSWGVPTTDASISGYRIVWGQLLQSHNSVMDKTSMLTKVLPKDSRTIGIGNLQEGTTYSVRVQAMSRSGAGRIASIHFTTPLLQLASRDPPYQEVDRGEHRNDPDDDQYYDGDDVYIAAAPSTTRNSGRHEADFETNSHSAAVTWLFYRTVCILLTFYSLLVSC